MVRNGQNEDLVYSLLDLLTEMMGLLQRDKTLKFKDVIQLRSEGLDEVNYEVFETKHPFGRGQNNNG